METKHWIAGGSEKTVAVWVKDVSGKTICRVENCPGDWDNARLIAAAPELLAACIEIAALADGQGRFNMMEVAAGARAAIAKAKGE